MTRKTFLPRHAPLKVRNRKIESMLPWFKAKKRLTGVEWIAAEFRISKVAVEESILDEMFFAIPMAVIWKRFLDDFKEPAGFARLPREHQMSYFRASLADLERQIQNAEPETALPRRLFTFYLAFLINGNTALASEAAHFIDQYAQKGWELAFANHQNSAESTKPVCR